MIRSYTLLLFACCSCGARLSYLGSSQTPTQTVDVYVDASAIERPYTIIGKGYMEYGLHARERIEKMQERAIEKARAKGADAVLFQDDYFLEKGSSVETVHQPDSAGRALLHVSTQNAGPFISSKTSILFLKYR